MVGRVWLRHVDERDASELCSINVLNMFRGQNKSGFCHLLSHSECLTVGWCADASGSRECEVPAWSASAIACGSMPLRLSVATDRRPSSVCT